MAKRIKCAKVVQISVPMHIDTAKLKAQKTWLAAIALDNTMLPIERDYANGVLGILDVISDRIEYRFKMLENGIYEND